jgi:hypothetical protein
LDALRQHVKVVRVRRRTLPNLVFRRLGKGAFGMHVESIWGVKEMRGDIGMGEDVS